MLKNKLFHPQVHVIQHLVDTARGLSIPRLYYYHQLSSQYSSVLTYISYNRDKEIMLVKNVIVRDNSYVPVFRGIVATVGCHLQCAKLGFRLITTLFWALQKYKWIPVYLSAVHIQNTLIGFFPQNFGFESNLSTFRQMNKASHFFYSFFDGSRTSMQSRTNHC